MINEILNKYNCKKYYIDLYESLFSTMNKNEIKSILEIGIDNGNSLKAWKELFPNAIIIGLDINLKIDKMDGVILIEGDQINVELIKKIINQYGPFDIIIDDGNHWMYIQQITFGLLFKSIKPNGLYIIEDVIRYYIPYNDMGFGKYGVIKGMKNSTLTIFREMCETKIFNSIYLSKSVNTSIQSTIKNILIFDNKFILYSAIVVFK